MPKSLCSNCFILTWKKILLLIVLSLLSILLHNLLSELFGQEEAFFFILVLFLIPFYTIIATISTLAQIVRKQLTKNGQSRK